MRLPEAILTERDAQFYQAHMNGASFRQIAKANNVSVSTVHAGFMRHQKRHSKITAEVSRDMTWDHIGQYNSLLMSYLPYTRSRKMEVEGPDGQTTEVELPPSVEYLDRVLKIMAAQEKLMGLGKDVISFQTGGSDGPGIGSGEGSVEATPEQLAREFAAELLKNGVMKGEMADTIEKMMALNDVREVVDAEIIEDEEQLAIGPSEPEVLEWIEEDDEYVPGGWLPDDMESGSIANER